MRILFLHPMLRKYRTDFFNEISKLCNVKFIFTSTSKKNWAENEFQKINFDYKMTLEIQNPIINEGFVPFLPFDLINNKYDCIVLSIPYSFPSIISFIVSKILRKKIITFDETWLWPKNLKYKILFPIYKFILRHSDVNIVTGSKSKEFYLNLGINKKIFTCYNCCALLKERKKEAKTLRKKLDIKKDDFVFLYFGRLVEYKGTEILIKAFKNLIKIKRNLKLIIAGTGNIEKKIKEIVKNEKIENVIFTGYVPENEKEIYFSMADCFVLPSKIMKNENVNCEAWGFTLNEAVSIEKPVIATTAVGSAYDLIENKMNGYLVKENNVEELYKAMEKIYNTKNLVSISMVSKKIINEKNNCKNSAKNFLEAVNYLKTH